MRSYEELEKDEELDLEGNVEDQYEFGMCLLLGNGCKMNIEKAEGYLRLAAQAGHSKAKAYFSQKTEEKTFDSNHVVTQKKKESVDYSSMSNLQLYHSAEKGDIRAAVALVKKMKKDSQTESDILRILHPFANVATDDIDALAEVQYLLGELYEEGNSIYQNEKQAFLCYQNAAEFDYDPAISKIAHCYENGIGTQKDLQKALFYKERATQHGSAKSCYELGETYRNGVLTKANGIKALVWYAKAVESKDEDIYYYLSAYRLLLANEPCLVNKEEALSIIEKNAIQGDIDCLHLLIETASNSNEQLGWYGMLLPKLNLADQDMVKQTIIELLLEMGDHEDLLENAQKYSCLNEIVKKGIANGYQVCMNEFLKEITTTYSEHNLRLIAQKIDSLEQISHNNQEGKQLKEKVLKELRDLKDKLRNENIICKEHEKSEKLKEKQVEERKRKFLVAVIMGIIAVVFCIYQFVVAPMISEFNRDYFEYLSISYDGPSPMTTIKVSSLSDEITYTSNNLEKLKNGDKIIITATNTKSGKTKEKEHVVDAPRAYVTSNSEFETFQKDYLSMLMRVQRDYFYYTYNDENAGSVFSTKLIDAYLLTRENYSISYAEDKVNQLVGVVEVTFDKGKQVYGLITLKGIYQEGYEEIDLDKKDYSKTETFFGSKTDALNAMNQSGYVVNQIKDIAISQSDILSLPTLIGTSQATSYKGELKDLVKEYFQYAYDDYSFDGKAKNVSSYDLKQLYFLEQTDQMMIHKDERANGAVGIYQFVMDDGESMYAAMFIPNIYLENEIIKHHVIYQSDYYLGTLEATPEEALQSVSKRYDVTSLK